MTSRNGSKGSKNQSSPQAGHQQAKLGAGLVTGNNNKGEEYRSRMGSKSNTKHED
ncbi:hypothetical protein ACFDTO_16685 [Microbacteriaceae bacterium 4G12]